VKRLVLLAAVTACAPEAPAEPSWAADVLPLLAANCVRCHGAPAIGGAPAGFRLDRLDDRAGDLEPIQGAAAMRDYLALRAGEGHGALLDHQIETLARWDGALGPPRTGNHPPLLSLLGVADPPPVRDAILVDYELRDPDFELLSGELRAGETFADAVVVDDSLRAGRGRAGFSTGAFPEADVRVWAAVADGSELVITDLGRFPTNHDGDIASRVEITAPRPFAILSDSVPTTIVFRVTDVDSPGPFIADVRATPDPQDPAAEPVVIATGFEVPAGGAAIPWPTGALAEGERWQLTVSVADAAGSGGGASVGSLVVSHATTDETFGSLADVFARCAECHADLTSASAARAARAAIHHRVIQQRDMPPRSAELLGIPPLSEAERDRLASWLLAGAP
jgi:hypothetical protein